MGAFMAERHTKNWELHLKETETSALDVATEFIGNFDGLPEGNGFLVEEQTAGRGRMGRVWISRKNDGMYFSVILTPKRGIQEWPTLSFVASLAAVQTLSVICPDVPVSLKWPNDLMVDNKKIGGILLESASPHVIIGCGINIKNAPDITDAVYPSTDIANYQADLPDAQEIANAYMSHLEVLYEIWQNCGPAPILARWQDKSNIIGRQLTVKVSDKMVSGKCEALEPDGRLNLVDSDGNVHLITVGDVVLMGEADAAGH